jgi:hypothetical protein
VSGQISPRHFELNREGRVQSSCCRRFMCFDATHENQNPRVYCRGAKLSQRRRNAVSGQSRGVWFELSCFR